MRPGHLMGLMVLAQAAVLGVGISLRDGVIIAVGLPVVFVAYLVMIVLTTSPRDWS